MVELGFALSTEDHRPDQLIDQARRAEQGGFDFAMISDHYHPWTRHQGESPFVWSVLGALAEATDRLVLATAVTCPTVRIHPAVLAQAAATTAVMMPDRFLFGVGSGEHLNEHVLGDRWPPVAVRHEMLEESLEVIRALWAGGQRSHHGRHYTVENAEVFTRPAKPPPILVAAAGPRAAALAGRVGDGLIATDPDPELVAAFRSAGGERKPCYGGVKVCWAADEATARLQAREWWPVLGLTGELGQVLPTPAHFEQATARVTEEEIAAGTPCTPDPETHIAALREYVDAGFDHVYVHQVNPDADGFFEFYEEEVLPAVS